MTKKSVCQLFLMLALSALAALPVPARADDIFYANNRLTLGHFLEALDGNHEKLSNSNPERFRRDADVYLYGVIDVTEGKIWCSFRDIKSSELLNRLRSLLRKVDKSRHNERVAHIITSLLQREMPCKKEKS